MEEREQERQREGSGLCCRRETESRGQRDSAVEKWERVGAGE